MIENRSFLRMQSPYFLEVSDRNTNQLTGHMADISTRGIKLTGKRAFKTETDHQLEMELPVKFGQHQKLFFDAKIKWCKKDDNFDFYNIGIQMHDLSQEDMKTIRQFIMSSWQTILQLI